MWPRRGTRRELIEKGILPVDRGAGDVSLGDLVSQGLLSDGSIERLAFEAESFIVVLDGEHRNVGATIRAYASEVARLVRERRHIIEERDRTFALVLARAEAAEARAARLDAALQPFADAADEADEYDHDDETQAPVDCGQCRAARAAMESKP